MFSLTILLKISFPEVVPRKCSVKKLFLEISQNSQENTCVRVSFVAGWSATLLKKEILAQVFSCEFCKLLHFSHKSILLIYMQTYLTSILSLLLFTRFGSFRSSDWCNVLLLEDKLVTYFLFFLFAVVHKTKSLLDIAEHILFKWRICYIF